MVAALLSGGSVPGVPLGQLGRRRVPVEVARMDASSLEHLGASLPLVSLSARQGVLHKAPQHVRPVDRSDSLTGGHLTLEQRACMPLGLLGVLASLLGDR